MTPVTASTTSSPQVSAPQQPSGDASNSSADPQVAAVADPEGGEDADTAVANTKEKTPMCLINELARFNKITHQYRLVEEAGPAHKKNFTVVLKLGDTEEYMASGSSIKRAQHAAAFEALNATHYKHPPLKRNSKPYVGPLTPTVELNALAMKRGELTLYRVMEVPRMAPHHPTPFMPHPSPHAPAPTPATAAAAAHHHHFNHHFNHHNHPNFNFRGMYHTRYHMPKVMPLYCASLTVGDREFHGEGPTEQMARHAAAERALALLRTLPLPEHAKTRAATAAARQVQRHAINAGNHNNNNGCVGGGGSMLSASAAPFTSALPLPTSGCSSSGADQNNCDSSICGGSSSSGGVVTGALKSPISQVYEVGLKRGMAVQFDVVAESGPPHMRHYVTRCRVGDDFVIEGTGNGKKVSKKEAAEKMVELLKSLPPLPPPPTIVPHANAVQTGSSNQSSSPNDPNNNAVLVQGSDSSPTQQPQQQTSSNRPSSSGGNNSNSTKKASPPKRKNRNLIKDQVKSDSPSGVNPISRLIQIQQAKKQREPVYTLIAERGDPRQREFVIQCQLNGMSTQGSGSNKKTAKRNAAEAMLLYIGYGSSNATAAVIANGIATSADAANGNVVLTTKASTASTSSTTFKGGNTTSTTAGRQLKPGLLLMPSSTQLSSTSAATSSTAAGGSVVDGARCQQNGMNARAEHMARASIAVTSAIARELLDSGRSPTAEAVVQAKQWPNAPPALHAGASPKEQLLYLAEVVGFQVHFTDFPKASTNDFFSLVALSINPLQMSDGVGDDVEASRNMAALAAMRSLAAEVQQAPVVAAVSQTPLVATGVAVSTAKAKSSNGSEISGSTGTQPTAVALEIVSTATVSMATPPSAAVSASTTAAPSVQKGGIIRLKKSVALSGGGDCDARVSQQHQKSQSHQTSHGPLSLTKQ